MSGCGICGPAGWTGFSGKYRVAPSLLEVLKNLHMGYKIGNSGLGSRPRPALRLSLIIPQVWPRCQQANRTKIKKVFQMFLFKSLNRHFYPKSAIRTKKEVSNHLSLLKMTISLLCVSFSVPPFPVCCGILAEPNPHYTYRRGSHSRRVCCRRGLRSTPNIPAVCRSKYPLPAYLS